LKGKQPAPALAGHVSFSGLPFTWNRTHIAMAAQYADQLLLDGVDHVDQAKLATGNDDRVERERVYAPGHMEQFFGCRTGSLPQYQPAFARRRVLITYPPDLELPYRLPARVPGVVLTSPNDDLWPQLPT
jgi:hypothetical protein